MSWRHAATRALVALGTLVFVLVFNFFLFRAVGDPKKDLIRSRLSPAAREAVIRERGLDKDKLTQFRIYIRADRCSGDLGTSTNSRKPVWDELMAALPNTLILVGIATRPVRPSSARGWGWWRRVAGAARTDTLLTQGGLVLWSMPFFFIGDPGDLAVRRADPDLPDRPEEHAGRRRPAARRTTATCSSTRCCRSRRSPPACSRSTR